MKEQLLNLSLHRMEKTKDDFESSESLLKLGKYAQFERCIQTLETSYMLINKAEKESIEYEVYRNSVIKGFELSLEISGKLLRKALNPYFATSKEVYSLIFKDLFRHAAKHGLLTIEETQRWLEYRDNRNTTAHDYGQKFAEKTLALIPNFILDSKELLKRLKNAKNQY